MAGATPTWRGAIHNLLEGDLGRGKSGIVLQRFIVGLILLNGVAVILESNRALHATYGWLFSLFELFSVAVFTLEYLGRVWVAVEREPFARFSPWRARIRYVLSPMALIDLLAIAPFYLALFVAIDLRYLRFFRLLRLLKLSHYFDGLRIFSEVIRREATAIAAAMLTMLILIIVSACLMFSVENAAQPGHFESITQAIWWAVVTLTTVGYGDITPITFAGKLLAMVIMMLGIGTMALPAGILAARFSEELNSRREYVSRRVATAYLDGVLDDDEEETVRRLQKELGLSREIVDRMVSSHRHLAQQRSFCSHCGERID
ncbi:potassium channel protein [Pseudohalioglobus lutimaris]|uniref:Potassium channel protein n=1 Tax=Pseudohalioglobus lutimaris TaxID=1737061 RepID=A0A2N5X883_9GAMM|nr:potassium channel protein [Pseudohalioglobus lutimaris]